jgi:hypothetical protein
LNGRSAVVQKRLGNSSPSSDHEYPQPSEDTGDVTDRIKRGVCTDNKGCSWKVLAPWKAVYSEFAFCKALEKGCRDEQDQIVFADLLARFSSIHKEHNVVHLKCTSVLQD